MGWVVVPEPKACGCGDIGNRIRFGIAVRIYTYGDHAVGV